MTVEEELDQLFNDAVSQLNEGHEKKDVYGAFRKYSFADPNVKLRVELGETSNVLVTLACRLFQHVDTDGPPDWVQVTRVIDPSVVVSVPEPIREFIENLLRDMWREMFDHEFQENLRRGGEFVFEPHPERNRLELP